MSPNSDFSIYNLPFGIFSRGRTKRIGSRIGDYVIDLKSMHDAGFFEGIIVEDVFEKNFLNDFIQLGKSVTNRVRLIVQEELLLKDSSLKSNFSLYFFDVSSVTMHLPLKVGDYTDFYSSRHHAENVGRLFRGGDNPLTENWIHMPIAYHGRASSIVVSGTEIVRPEGQLTKQNKVVFGPSEKVDFELEFATVIGKSNQLGNSIDISNSEEYIFGFCLLNDWSARDIQSWEYKPLGPFLGKNFATTISPWIVTIEALKSFRVSVSPKKKVLPYLQMNHPESFDINLKVHLNDQEITHTNFSKMYWTVHQQIAHHTVNGCNLQVGDVLGSGTISDEKEKGSLLEQTYNGEKPLKIKGELRTFVENGDTVSLSGYAEKNGVKVGFGEAVGTLKKRKNNE
ncbi:MAG: fumarylacetoacetase [Flavobacteriales bacterium]